MHFSLKQIKKVKSMRFMQKMAEINTMHAYNTQNKPRYCLDYRFRHAKIFTDTRFRNKQTSEYTFTISTPVQL